LFDRLGFFLDRDGLRAHFTVFAEKRKEVLGEGRHDGWMDGWMDNLLKDGSGRGGWMYGSKQTKELRK
jgi:hypothetical protein